LACDDPLEIPTAEHVYHIEFQQLRTEGINQVNQTDIHCVLIGSGFSRWLSERLTNAAGPTSHDWHADTFPFGLLPTLADLDKIWLTPVMEEIAAMVGDGALPTRARNPSISSAPIPSEILLKLTGGALTLDATLDMLRSGVPY
jgi:hypothetical protein